MKSDQKTGNVIDMTERIHHPDFKEYLRGLKVRFDLENAKVAISASLLSVVLLATLANDRLVTTVNAAAAAILKKGLSSGNSSFQ